VEIKYEVDSKKNLSVPDILPRFSSIKTEREDFTNFDDSPLFAGSYSVMGISDNKNASPKIHTSSSASDESSFSEDGGRSSLSPAAVPSNGPTDYSSTSSASAQSGGVSAANNDRISPNGALTPGQHFTSSYGQGTCQTLDNFTGLVNSSNSQFHRAAHMPYHHNQAFGAGGGPSFQDLSATAGFFHGAALAVQHAQAAHVAAGLAHHHNPFQSTSPGFLGQGGQGMSSSNSTGGLTESGFNRESNLSHNQGSDGSVSSSSRGHSPACGSGGGGIFANQSGQSTGANKHQGNTGSAGSYGDQGLDSKGDGSSVSLGNKAPVAKREIRLIKNREAARECRRKKKEYIKCLENRVAVLENQNKALIEELKSLKELYNEGKSLPSSQNHQQKRK